MTPEEFAEIRRGLTDTLIDILVSIFLGLGDWRGQTDRDVFLEQAIPQLRGTQTALGSLVAAYTAERASEALGRIVAPPSMPDLVNLRRGVDDLEVYERPFTELYTALSQGKDFRTALGLAETRLREIAEFDMQQTYAVAGRAARENLPEDARPRYWRRVLVGTENCGLCVIASTQRYKVDTLNPIHPACDCSQEPLFGPDPGQVLDEELLERVHEAVEGLTGRADRGARAPDYRDLMVEMTAEHGELGSLLVRPRDHFTGPADI